MKNNKIDLMLSVLTGILGFIFGCKFENRKEMYNIQIAKKNRTQFILLNQWMKLKQAGGNLANYLSDKGYRRIAVYGMSYLGENVVTELKNSDIEVAYGIDERGVEIVSDVKIYVLQDDLPCVDAVVVSETAYFKDVAPLLKEKLCCPIVSLEEVVYES